MLQKGTGGIQELKETVIHYIEQSPLYGFVQYRRRKVLLKYVPEGTSRLLQGRFLACLDLGVIKLANHSPTARLAVHFQSVIEKFSPHDTIFSFTAPSELIDSALSAACSLHTAPASIKSSTSLRRKGLAGITEDASENQTVVSPISDAEPDIVKTSDVKDDDTRLDGKSDASPSPPVESRSSPAPSSRTNWNTDKALPPTPDSPHEDEKPKSTDHDGFSVRTSFEERQSSQFARPTTREGYSGYEYKPKVKLGPRPSIDSNAGNPSSDPASRAYDPRPVATLPATVRMPARKTITPRPAPPRKRTPPNSPPTPVSNSIATFSVVSNNSSTTFAPTINSQRPTPKPIDAMSTRSLAMEPKAPIMTPEKKRLMKALELRQKQIAAQKKQQLVRVEGATNQLEHNSATKPVQDDDLLRLPIQSAEALATPDYLQNVIREDDSGIVPTGDAELIQSSSVKADISPISVPEASDGPSTQASSISEERSGPVGKETDHMPTASIGNAGPSDGTPQLAEVDQKACNLYNGSNPNQPDRAVASKTLDAMELQSESIAQQEDLAAPQEHGLAQDDPHPEFTGGEDDGVTFPPQTDCAAEDMKDIPDTRPLSDREQAVQTPSYDALRTQSSGASTPSRGSEQPSLGSTGNGTDIIYPHEVPLPAIGDDEEKRLSPQEASFNSADIVQPISPRESSDQLAPRILYHPIEEDGRVSSERTSAETKPSASDTGSDRHDICQNKRHGLIEPVRRISSGENSDDQFLSDDSFMEELTSATVQEAKPISVSKSPITPVFPRSVSEQGQESKANRSVSTPLEVNKVGGVGVSPESTALLPPRSVSVTKPRSTSPSDNSPPMLGKVAVSSGISQRIKALEKLQSRPLSPSSQVSSSTNAPPLFSSLGSRKSSFRSRPGTPDRPRSRQAMLALSPVLSPTTNFEVKQPKPYNQFVSVKVASKPGKSRPDSISVTARIVRDEWNQTPEVPCDASQPRVMDLHHSPLKVEHKSADAKSASRKPPMKRHSTAPSISSNSTDQRSEPMSYSKRDSVVSASNYSRRGSDTEIPRSASEISLSGMIGGDGAKEERKESRKSRLLKRMSNSMAASRRSIATALSPPPVREESIAEQHEPIQEVPSAFVEIGDVNIQFPDTLVSKNHAALILTNTANSSGNADTWRSMHTEL